jgi:hypothetical protein
MSLYPRSFFPAPYPFPHAAPVFFTHLESMIAMAAPGALPRIARSDNASSRNIRPKSGASPFSPFAPHIWQ